MDKVKEATGGTAQLTKTEALAVLEQDAREREQACWNDIEVVLKKHRCRFEVTILLKTGQVIPQLTVVAD